MSVISTLRRLIRCRYKGSWVSSSGLRNERRVDFSRKVGYNFFVRNEYKGPSRIMSHLSLCLLLSTLFLFSACSLPSWTPSWFPIKKAPPHQAKNKDLVDKEVLIIDREEYVKVLNPKASEGGQPKYLYVPVRDYLANKDSFTIPTYQKEKPPPETLSVEKSEGSALEKEGSSPGTLRPFASHLKKKILVARFDDRMDRNAQGEESLGDWATEKLIKELNRRSLQTLVVDFEAVKEFLTKRGISPSDLETPQVLRLINEVFGIQALVVGQLSGPYVFTTKPGKEGKAEETSSAILKIDLSVLETFSGKRKTLSVTNPIVATRERGAFSEEKAKVKAVELAVADLGRALVRELEGLDWFCRVAKVDDGKVFLNAGRLTGLKVGDVLSIVHRTEPGKPEEMKGKLRISALFGIDASVGNVIDGTIPESNDILTLTKPEGNQGPTRGSSS